MTVGGLDLGTTGCKIAIFDENAALQDVFYCEYPAYHADGRHEIDFNDIKNGVFSILRQAAEKYEINAIGVTSFGETFAMLDEDDNILTRSMIYTDPRGTEECEELKARFGEERLTLDTGISPHPMYSIPKILWWKRNHPEIFSKCRRILLGTDFGVYILTGKACIDYSLASRTGVFDIGKKQWMRDVLDYCGISEDLLSAPVPIGTVVGGMKEDVKALLGIKNDVTVVSGCQDQLAALMGSGIFSAGRAMDGIGTVECIPVVLKERPADAEFYKQGFALVPFLNDAYVSWGYTYTGGGSLKWFRNSLAPHEFAAAEAEGKNVYAELDAQISDKPTGIFVLPHFSGAATPYMDIGSRAAIVGLSMETSKADIYKAVMEGVSYEMLQTLKVMEEFAGEITEIRATGGGAASDTWLQIKADVYGREIVALDCREVGGAGIAALAGTAVGIYPDLESTVAKMATVRKVFSPHKERAVEYARLYKKYEGLYRAVRQFS